MKCPSCNNEMSNGYRIGDLCYDCYDIGEAADEIIGELHKYCPALTVVRTGVEGGVRDVIRSVIRQRFF